MTRHGARALQNGDAPGTAREVWRDTVARAADQEKRWEPDEVWVADRSGQDGHDGRDGWDDGQRIAPARRQTGDARGTAPERVRKGARRPASDAPTGWGQEQPAPIASTPSTKTPSKEPSGHRRNVPKPVVQELSKAAGQQRGAKLSGRLADATHAYDRERYIEARRILRPLVEEVPDAAAVQELYGLVLYRSGQWVLAAKHLELYRHLSGSTDQNPVLADCYRALRRYDDAEERWDELRAASPSGDVIAEGRIVAAGCRADQGDLAGAIALLERAGRRVNRPQEHHVRQWYALADLYERAGDIPRARELFGRIDAADPDAFDVRQRLRALR